MPDQFKPIYDPAKDRFAPLNTSIGMLDDVIAYLNIQRKKLEDTILERHMKGSISQAIRFLDVAKGTLKGVKKLEKLNRENVQYVIWDQANETIKRATATEVIKMARHVETEELI